MSFNEITSVTIPNFGILELKLNDESVKDLEAVSYTHLTLPTKA